MLTCFVCASILFQTIDANAWWAVTTLSIDCNGNRLTNNDYKAIESVVIKFRLIELINKLKKEPNKDIIKLSIKELNKDIFKLNI